MLLVLGAVAGFVAGLATGGTLQNLMARRLRWPLLVVAALLVKELLVRSPLGGSPLAATVFAISLVVLIGWTAWHWGRLPGIWLVTAGMTLNLVVVLANGGRMPVVPAAAHLGPPQLLQDGVWGQYTLMGAGTRLGWLGDWILFPSPVSRLVPQAYSPGDMVSLVGLAVVMFLVTRPTDPLARPRAITSRLRRSRPPRV